MHAIAELGIALQGDKVKARLLVIADGATSRLATKLGYCTEPPRGVCSRAFVEGGTHNTDFDGMSQHAKQPFLLSMPRSVSCPFGACASIAFGPFLPPLAGHDYRYHSAVHYLQVSASIRRSPCQVTQPSSNIPTMS